MLPLPKTVIHKILCCVVVAFFSSTLLASAQSSQKEPIILAAANIRPALEEIAQNYQKQTRHSLKIIYGSSGHFYQQIVNGGKFDLFLSADENFIDRLYLAHQIPDNGVIYARGKLALWLSRKAFDAQTDLNTFQNALKGPRITKIAIANPALAPYGKASEQVLRQWTDWPSISHRIILGESVGQAAQFALSGSVQAALLPVSLTMHPELQKNGIILPIPDPLYAPILQRMSLLSQHEVAISFFQFLQNNDSKRIWKKYGYE